MVAQEFSAEGKLLAESDPRHERVARITARIIKAVESEPEMEPTLERLKLDWVTHVVEVGPAPPLPGGCLAHFLGAEPAGGTIMLSVTYDSLTRPLTRHALPRFLLLTPTPTALSPRRTRR